MKIDIEEALRYLGAAHADGPTRQTVAETAAGLEEKLAPRYVYRVFRVERGANGILLPEANLSLPGKLAATMLEECDQAVLLCCTLGAAFDRLLRLTQARSMGAAAILNACGNAYVEAGCGEAEREIAARYPGMYLTDRFSPGYGDLPLAVQPDFLSVLNAEKRLGVTVTESCLMVPVKTVTAVTGLSASPQPARIRGCGYCGLQKNCAYRERGKHCGL